MTVGNPKLIVRVPRELIAEVKEAIRRRNLRSREEPWVISDFVRIALRDKLHHMQRSRGRKRRAKKPDAGNTGEPKEDAA